MWGSSDLNSSKTSGGFIPQSNKKLTTKKSCLVPCTVHELVSANLIGDSLVNSNKIELNLVSIVGVIRSVDSSESFVQYRICDGSGSTINVKQFSQQMNNDQFIVNKYVKVIGQIKRYNDVNSITSVKIIPLKSFNEVALHIVSVIHSHKQIAIKSNEIALENTKKAPVDELVDKIVNVFKMNRKNGTQGISVEFIKSALSGCNPEQVLKKLRFMESEGTIYSTINEDHYVLNE